MSDYELIIRGQEKGIILTKINNLKLLRNRINHFYRELNRKSNFDNEYKDIVDYLNTNEQYQGGLTYEHLANFDKIYVEYLNTKH